MSKSCTFFGVAVERVPQPVLRERVAGEIRAQLARRRLPQKALARALGMSPQSLSSRVLAQVAFDVDELEATAAFLGVSLGQLLGLSEGRPPEPPSGFRTTPTSPRPLQLVAA